MLSGEESLIKYSPLSPTLRAGGDLYWRIMCKECGSCSKEHTNTIDDAIDKVLDSPI